MLLFEHLCQLIIAYTISTYADHAGVKLSKRTPKLLQKSSRVSMVYEPDLPNCTEPMCIGPLAEIYCTGKFLHTSWLFGLHDSCPGDMMRQPPDQILQAFKKLQYPIKREDFKAFCYENFDSTPYLRSATLTDWTDEPQNIRSLKNTSLWNFTRKLNEIWKQLGREFIPQVRKLPDRFPVLAVPNPFVVPGGQFQVYFYWDSYWIIKGLLFSNMTQTVRNMIENFAYVIQFHGFIPNAGTIQLTRRSQPPLFTQMVADYFDVTHNKTFLSQMLLYIDSELSWWRTNRSTTVTLEDGGGNYSVFQYKAITDCPRPENYLVDIDNGYHGSDNPNSIWSSIASACESGLDFSSRWFAYSGEQAGTKFSIRTNKIIPVDLNVFMTLNYMSYANMLDAMGQSEKAITYRKYADDLHEAIQRVMWNDTDGIWYDYDLEKKTHRQRFYPSNIFPLILDSPNKRVAKRVLAYLKKIDVLKYPGGIPATLESYSHEQWDFPNGWGPSIHLFVESLRRSGDEELYNVSRRVATGFIRTVYNGLMNPRPGWPSACWEKYDVRFDDGRPGIGGEYPVQQGFGWTNGAVLDMIYHFYINLSRENEQERSLSVTSHLIMPKRYMYLLLLMVALFVLTSAWLSCRMTTRQLRNRMQVVDIIGKPEESHLIADTDSD